jgi:hypothetical protein
MQEAIYCSEATQPNPISLFPSLKVEFIELDDGDQGNQEEIALNCSNG